MIPKEHVDKTLDGLHEFLLSIVSAIAKDTKILDVGCGTGAWLERLANSGFTDLYGFDRNPATFTSDSAVITKLDLDCGTPDMGGTRFGLITAIEVIEHLENPGHLWDLVASYLADDGLFLFTTPNISSLHSRLRFLLSGKLPFFDAKSDQTHVQPFYLPAVLREMARRGLKLERIWPFPPTGSSVFRAGIVRLSAVLRMVLPDDLRGDIICIVVRRVTG